VHSLELLQWLCESVNVSFALVLSKVPGYGHELSERDGQKVAETSAVNPLSLSYRTGFTVNDALRV